MSGWTIAFALASLPLVASYIAYPIVLWILVSLQQRKTESQAPVARAADDALPTVSVAVAVHNEQDVIEAKLRNLLDLDYPADLLQIAIVSDCSTDATCERARALLAARSPEERERVRLFERSKRTGKTIALSETMPQLNTRLIVFSDANTMYAPDAVQKLVDPFRDPKVGLVCGNLEYLLPDAGGSEGEALYWLYENFLKRLEGELGRLLVSNGSIYAIRRELFEPVPGPVADDLALPLTIAEKGYRRVYALDAKAREPLPLYPLEEFRAKARIVAQGFAAIRHYRRTIQRLDALSIVQLLLHKVLRWLSVPLMGVMLIASILGSGLFLDLMLAGQLLFYAIAVIGLALRRSAWFPSVLRIPAYYCLVNLAAFKGLLEFARGRAHAIWEKSESTRVLEAPEQAQEGARVLFLTHYFPPEVNAPASRVYELTKRWVRAGQRVTVITCAPNMPEGKVYPGYRNQLWQREEIDGIEVLRVWTFMAANRGVALRIVNYLSYMVSATLRGLFVPRPDLVVATSPQFFCGWAGVLTKWLRRRPLLLEIRDAWPESIVAVDAIRNRATIAFLEWLESRMYHAADHIVTVADSVREVILGRDVSEDEISTIAHGVEPALFQPTECDEEMKVKLGLGGKFVCSFVGTIGLACGLEVALRAAKILKARGPGDIAFLLVGNGAVRADLEARAAAEELDNVVFTGRQERSLIPRLLALSDCCLVHLIGHECFRKVVPSKTFEAMAMGRPVILGGGDGAAAFLRSIDAGLPIEPENEHQLVEALIQLRDNDGLCKRLGASGRAYAVEYHDREVQASVYLKLVQRVAKQFQQRKSGPEHATTGGGR